MDLTCLAHLMMNRRALLRCLCACQRRRNTFAYASSISSARLSTSIGAAADRDNLAPAPDSCDRKRPPPYPSTSNSSTSEKTINHEKTTRKRSEDGTNDVRGFEGLADPAKWFDELRGTFRPLHSFNRVRIPWVLAHFGKDPSSASPLVGKRILDVGCGAGILSMALCRLGASVIGLDASESVVKVADSARNTLAPEIRSDIEFVHGTVEELSAKQDMAQGFDAVIASEVIEHVADLPSFIRNCCHLARPNSPLFFTTINRTFLSQLLVITIAEDVLQIVPKGLHDFEKFVTPVELKKLLLEENCRVGPTLGLFYNPISNSWSWSSFTEVNYALVAFTRKNG